MLYGKINIEQEIFDNLISLKSLDINQNVLNDLPLKSFRNLTNFKTISVSLNDYVRFYENSNSLPESNNGKLFNLPNKLFANLKSLKTINLKFNNSMELTNNTFGHNFGKIQNLSISGYQLETLPSGIFDKTQNIKVLQISHNHLTSLPPNIFENLLKLEVLDLSFNKFQELGL